MEKNSNYNKVSSVQIIWLVLLFTLGLVKGGQESDGRSSLAAGEVLSQGECLVNDQASACLGENGRLSVSVEGKEIWANKEKSKKSKKEKYFGMMQKDGQFAIFLDDGSALEEATPVWSTGSSSFMSSVSFELAPDGSLGAFSNFLMRSTLWQATGEESSSSAADKVTEPVTGIDFPVTKSFSLNSTSPTLTLTGVGVRVKALVGPLKVNVYGMGLYVDPSRAARAFSKYKGKDAKEVAKDDDFFKILHSPGFAKAIYIDYARAVGVDKVVDALRLVPTEDTAALDYFCDLLVIGTGSTIGNRETMTLGWEGKDKLVVQVRDKTVGTVTSAKLVEAVFELYLGKNSIVPSSKESIAGAIIDLVN